VWRVDPNTTTAMFSKKRIALTLRLRRGNGMAHHRKDPTTNVASGWRKAQRDTKKDVRVEARKPQMERKPFEKGTDNDVAS
jgi:hypothetical protein